MCSFPMNVCSCGYSSLIEFEIRTIAATVVADDSKDCLKVAAGRKGDGEQHAGYQSRCLPG